MKVESIEDLERQVGRFAECARGCANVGRCAGVEADAKLGVVPRGVFFERGHNKWPARGWVVVGLNPGKASKRERNAILSGSCPAEYWTDYVKDVHGYYTRIRECIRAVSPVGPIIWTELVKCQSEPSMALPPSTVRTCFYRHLRRELKAYPANWIVVAVGKVAFSHLVLGESSRAVIGITHPTGAYGNKFKEAAAAIKSTLRAACKNPRLRLVEWAPAWEGQG